MSFTQDISISANLSTYSPCSTNRGHGRGCGRNNFRGEKGGKCYYNSYAHSPITNNCRQNFTLNQSISHNPLLVCQVCNILEHNALNYPNRFNHSYRPEGASQIIHTM